jgi:type IV pilus biogenesis protein CpaD/CtpE
MKYKVIELSTGDLAVGYGVKNKRFFPDTVTTNRAQAEIQAVEKSAQYYLQMIDRCQRKWEELQGGETNENGSNFGDILA